MVVIDKDLFYVKLRELIEMEDDQKIKAGLIQAGFLLLSMPRYDFSMFHEDFLETFILEGKGK